MNKGEELTRLTLPVIPKDEFYEDYVAAILSVCGLFIERRINLSDPISILELDIVTTKFFPDHTEKYLSEIKSGDWGLTDVFKVRGWLDYLHYNKALFVVLDNQKQQFEEYQNVAASLQIDLINVTKQSDGRLNANDILNDFGVSSIDKKVFDCAVPVLRYAYCMERLMIEKYLKPLAKEPNITGYKELKDYMHNIHDYSFFAKDDHARLLSVFGSFQRYNHITAKIDLEKVNGVYDENYDNGITEESFSELFYKIPPKQNPLHVALYAEMYNRLIMLKLVIEDVVRNKTTSEIIRTLSRLSLPSNIQRGIDSLVSYAHFYLYPVLWQNFIFVMGGFILKDKKEDEYHVLSVLSGVPESEVENALSAFDILFPIDGGSWFIDKPNTSIKILNFMPLPFSGLGANFRRIYYDNNSKNDDYSHLKGVLSGKYTINDLIKMNNLGVEYLSKAKNLIVPSK